MYYVFERGMDRGADREGGHGRDSTRNESGLERERDEYDARTRDSLPLSVYLQGGGDRGTRRFFVCGVCVGMCGCEKITRTRDRGCVTA